MTLSTAPIIKYGICHAMEQSYMEIIYTDFGKEISKGNYNSLMHAIKEYKPDAFFYEHVAIFKNRDMFFKIAKSYDIPILYWAIDDPVEMMSESIRHAKKSLLTFTPSIECVEKYKRMGVDASFLMFGCNEDIQRLGTYNPKFNHDIIFIGNNYSRYPARMQGYKTMIEPLIKEGYDIKIYGSKWWIDGSQIFTIDEKFYGGYCEYNEIKDACESAKIILGIHSVNNSDTMMSVKSFEILGCKGFYLTQYTPAIKNYFINKKHLVWSKNSLETLRYVDYYLLRSKDREFISLQGQRECYLRHSYKGKINFLINELKRKGIWKDDNIYSNA
jgi:spore maturation protein CgeB